MFDKKSLTIITILCLIAYASLANSQQSVIHDISVNLDPMVRISALDDVILDPYNATVIVPALWYNWEPFCVYSNTGNQFEFTVTGSGPGGVFEVTSGSD